MDLLSDHTAPCTVICWFQCGAVGDTIAAVNCNDKFVNKETNVALVVGNPAHEEG